MGFKLKFYSTTLISALLVLGCSGQNAALKAVVAGTNVVCNDGHFIVFVGKRDGNSVEGVKITVTAPDGKITMLTADKGTLAKSDKPNCFKLKLYNGKTENGKATETWQLSVFDLQPIRVTQP